MGEDPKSDVDEQSDNGANDKEPELEEEDDDDDDSSFYRSSGISEPEGEDDDEEEDEDEFDYEERIQTNPDKFLRAKRSKSEAQNNLIAKIKSIKWSAAFAGNGTCYKFRALTNPGLYVQDKPWSFPLTSIPQCSALEDAPFGKGPATVLDPKVRKTLQVNPSDIKFKNPDYENDIRRLAKLAARDLGLVDYKNVEVHLHKLLIYREGDHFQEHRDAVHRKGMFGTLIVELPSVYTGGTLTVSHAGQSKEFKAQDEFQSTWVAFYGDCLHKIDPVTSGLRTVLTYDLIRTKTSTTEIKVPDPVEELSAKQEVLDWLADDEADDKLFIACEHLYPRSALGDYRQKQTVKHNYETVITLLKGADQARAKALYTEGLVIGIVSLMLEVEYDPEAYYTQRAFHAGDLYSGDDSGKKPNGVHKVRSRQVFAPNSFKNTPVKYMTSTSYVEYVGNESQLGAYEFTYSAIVLINQKKVQMKKKNKKT